MRKRLRLRLRDHLVTRRARETRDYTLHPPEVNIWRELRVPEELTRER